MSIDETYDDEAPNSSGEEGGTAPLFVMPGAGATTSQGLGAGAGVATGSPIVPQPLVSTSAETGDFGNGLAERIEHILADDGRFAPLLPRLVIEDVGHGHVTLSGSLTNPALRASLIATLHAVPGVTAVTDHLNTESS